MKIRLYAVCCFLTGLVCLELGAQEPATVRRVVLPSLDSQVRARLMALDRKRNPVHSPALAASVVGHLFQPASPFTAFTPIFADARNLAVWEQLPDEYHRLIQESGDALVTQTTQPTGAGWSSGQTRRLCHQRLASLPRACLDCYRQRVDAEAAALLAEGKRTRSALPLRRLVDELFCSSVGDQALDLLGDLAFERGHFLEAEHWWKLLAPLPAHGDKAGEDRLCFPRPTVDAIRTQAKQVLAIIFQGRLDEAQSEIARFHGNHPRARGRLAGQEDLYSRILQKTLAGFVEQRMVNNEEPWRTFGGNGARNHVLTQGLAWHLWEDGPTWRVKLPTLTSDAGAAAATAVPDRSSLTRRAAFHPVVINSQVLIADHRSVTSYHLVTGKQLYKFDLKAAGLNDTAESVSEKIGLPRFTLTVDHERAYVRMGRLGLGVKKDADKQTASYLICLDIAQPELKKPRLLWHVSAEAEKKSPSYFEGSPLVHEGRVYVALSKIVGRRSATSIVCYDLLGRQRWSREMCECPEFEDNADTQRYRQHLLTWAAGQVVYCSHAGAIVAVDATTGQPTWGVRYPSRGPFLETAEPSPRDLTPCLYADGQIFAAPMDTDRLFCIDAVTGQIHWETERVEIVQLMGVAQGRVMVSTRAGLQAVNTATGQIEWAQPTEGRLPGLGRGLIAGNWVLWPTTDANLPYRGVTLHDGQQQRDDRRGSLLPEPGFYEPTALAGMPVGNLAFGQGCLVVAGLDELIVFVPPHKLPKAPGEARPQARIESLYDRAKRQASAGEVVQAAHTYLALREATFAHSRATEWEVLIEGRLLHLVNMAPFEGIDSQAKESLFATYTDARMPAGVRLAAWRRQYDSLWQQGRSEDAGAVCRRILADPELSRAWLTNPAPQQGMVWALTQKKRLQETGLADASLLRDDEKSAAIYYDLKLTADPKRSPGSLLHLADRLRRARSWGAAADAYRRLLALSPAPDVQASGLLGLARAYEGQHQYGAAWRAWAVLEAKFADAVDPESGKTYRTLVPSPKTAPYRDALAGAKTLGPGLPVIRSWEQQAGRVENVQDADPCDDFFFCTRPGQISCRGSVDGKVRWLRQIALAPSWLGRWQDLIVIARLDGVEARQVDDGRVVWSFPAPSRMCRAGSVVGAIPRLTGSAGLVHVERWDDTLLLCDDEHALYRLRLDTGEVAWHFASPAAPIRPLDAAAFQRHVLRVGQKLLAQTVSGQPVWLDAQVASIGDPSRPWVQAPLVVNNRVIFPGEHGHIYAYDTKGEHDLRWIYKAPWPTSLTGDLCYLFGNEFVLLALVARNDGSEWVCLDPVKGQPLWTTRANQLAAAVDVASVCIVDTSYYYVRDGKLQAASLNGGATQWEIALPVGPTRWNVRYTKACLTVYPAEGAGFSVGFIDPWDGQWLERLTFDETRGGGNVIVGRDQVLVSVRKRIFGFRSLDRK